LREASANARAIIAGLTREQWPPLMDEVYRLLRPGGWIQCTEFRGSQFYSEGNRLPKNSALMQVRPCLSVLTIQFFEILDKMVANMNIYWNGYHLEDVIKRAGFEDVQVRTFTIDVGNWRDGKSQKTRSN